MEKKPVSTLNSIFNVYFKKTPLVSYALFLFSPNTWIHSLSPVPQITRFSLVGAIISSKTRTHSGSKKQKRSNSKVKNNKTIPGILSFIWILYLKQRKQYSLVLLHTENLNLFYNKMMFYVAEKDQKNYFVQNGLVKPRSSICKLFKRFFKIVESCKIPFHHPGNCSSWNVLHYNDYHIKLYTLSKRKKKIMWLRGKLKPELKMKISKTFVRENLVECKLLQNIHLKTYASNSPFNEIHVKYLEKKQTKK